MFIIILSTEKVTPKIKRIDRKQRQHNEKRKNEEKERKAI